MDIPQQINSVVFAESKLQLLKLWQWSVSAVYEDEETGIFKVLLRGSHFSGGGVSTFLNPDGTRLTPMEFDYIDDFHDGLAKVAIQGKGYGFISSSGEIIAPMVYEDAGFFHNNFSQVKKNGEWMLINRYGKEISLPRKYKDFGWMSNGRCRVSTMKITSWADLAYYSDNEYYAGLWGFIDEAGDEIIEPQYIYAMAFFDGFPVSPGHTLIIPKRHVASYFDLYPDELNHINELSFACRDILKVRYNPQGFNLGVNVGETAGQSIFHCHVHLIPRYTGDVANPRAESVE